MLREFISTSFKNGRISCAFLILTLAFAIGWGIYISARHKRDRKITPTRIMFVGTFISAVMYFLPLMQEILGEQGGRGFWTDAVLTSMQFAFRLFILDGELLWIFDEEVSILNDPAVKDFYTILGSILYVSAPILTFSFVLTFFNNLFARLAYFFSSLCHTHVFSELNEKSVALATDIKKQKMISFEEIDGKRKIRLNLNVIVFTEISDKVREEKMELVEDAHMLGAIMFNKDFDSIKFKSKLSKRKLYFYLISEDEEKKLRHAEVIMKNFDLKNVELRLFSPDIRSQLLMDSFSPKLMRAIRIDDIQTLVYHNLYTHGKMLFDRARTVEGEKDKVISAVIVGLGQYGKEMFKALAWFCQLEGYKLKITAFDSDKDAEAKIKYMCPELMDEKYNGKYTYGEPYYEIKIIGGIDVTTPTFREEIEKITDASYIFVCLGTDAINLRTATEIRSICENVNYGIGAHKPDIETVVYDSKLAQSLRTTWESISGGEEKGVTNFKEKPYNILITGDLNSFYSVSTLIDSQLIDAGFDVQLGYDAGKDPEKRKNPEIIKQSELKFWGYEYNFNSSTAQAIHLKLRQDMGCPRKDFTDEEWEKLTAKQKITYANPEHIRWSAYMRTRGYIKTVHYDKDERNDLGRRHHDLIPTPVLYDEDLKKD